LETVAAEMDKRQSSPVVEDWAGEAPTWLNRSFSKPVGVLRDLMARFAPSSLI
jgi:hypothetical protein